MDKILGEVGLSVERAIFAGLGAIPAVNIANVSSGKEWAAVGLTAASAAALSLLNSLRVLGNSSNAPSNQSTAPPL